MLKKSSEKFPKKTKQIFSHQQRDHDAVEK